ncbi:MAG TPA: hypothetical protein VJH24_04775 [Candidatus Bilamarchaeaceae archaeon]|nr:hypothetical protein [Candidatus Bilamarchaeaceae archaeon]
MDNRDALKKAAAIAKIHLTASEEKRLVGEIDDVLTVFSKIDAFNEPVQESPLPISRPLRKDTVQASDIDPFSNTKLVKNRKFIGPRLVD